MILLQFGLPAESTNDSAQQSTTESLDLPMQFSSVKHQLGQVAKDLTDLLPHCVLLFINKGLEQFEYLDSRGMTCLSESKEVVNQTETV